MSSPLTVQGFPDNLDSRFFEITAGEFKEEKDIIGQLFTTKDPDQLTMRGSGLTPLGLVPEFTGNVTYDGPDQGYAWSATVKEFALGLEIERKLVQFDQFDLIEKQWKLLARSARQTRQTYAIRPFTQAFSVDTAFDYTTDENLSLCNDAHTTTRAGVVTTTGFDNAGTAEFSPTSLKSAYATFRRFKDLAGQPIDENQATHVILPPELKLRAEEVFSTMRGLDEATGNKNVLEGEYKIIDFIRLTDTNNWFLVNLPMFKENHFWFDAEKAEFARMESFDNITARYRVYSMFGVGRTPIWQHCLGFNVS